MLTTNTTASNTVTIDTMKWRPKRVVMPISFLGLPAGMRSRIYHYALPTKPHDGQYAAVNLIRTRKQINSEATGIFHRQSSFENMWYNHRIHPPVLFLSTLFWPEMAKYHTIHRDIGLTRWNTLSLQAAVLASYSALNHFLYALVDFLLTGPATTSDPTPRKHFTWLLTSMKLAYEAVVSSIFERLEGRAPSRRARWSKVGRPIALKVHAQVRESSRGYRSKKAKPVE